MLCCMSNWRGRHIVQSHSLLRRPCLETYGEQSLKNRVADREFVMALHLSDLMV